MSKKLLVVDGNSILNRGFFGLPLLSDANGVFTNGVLGFLNILLKVLADETPDYLAVAFDVHAPTFRHKMYAAYKGTRKGMPEELVVQLPLIHDALKFMNIPIIEMAGYEADDILGTLAKTYGNSGYEVTVLSGDRDLLQISDEHIKISIPKTMGGKTDIHNYYPEDVLSEYGVTPHEFITVKALQGDSSDNIPGVPKVGPKTATELVQTYKTLDGIYSHIDEITKAALKTNLSENKDQAYMCLELVTIMTNAPVEFDIESASIHDFLNNESAAFLKEHGLNSILKRLEETDFTHGDGDKEAKASVEYATIEYDTVSDFNEATELIKALSKQETVGIYATDEGVSVSFGEKTRVIEFGGFLTKEFVSTEISKALENVKNVITFKIKDSYDYLGAYREGFIDLEILAYLLNPLTGKYSLSEIANQYTGKLFHSDEEMLANKFEYSAFVSLYSVMVYKEMLASLEKLNELKLFYEIEMPLTYVLFSMEKEGILIKPSFLKEYSEKLKVDIDELEGKIYKAAGTEFNINSPKQLGVILFENLNLPGGKKTKSGYSTAADVLDKLAGEYEIVKDILEYRKLTKLKSTYADTLESYADANGRIHTHFNQTVTATGRISSNEPNMQNIPIRTETGRELRKAFVPKDGFVFVDADYSQIELRLMAHMSGDEGLIDAFREGKDIHRATAAKVFKKNFDDVTDNERRNAKAVNFGIIYGISAFGLSEDIGITPKEAKAYIEEYFATYPKVKAFIDGCVETAKETGFSTTIYNRIRPIPELKESNFMRRQFGERVAMNAPLQGTAADIMKIAMIRVFDRLKKDFPNSKVLVQVHDEILVETPKNDADRVMAAICEEMANAASLKVELLADAHIGNDWYEAK